MELKNVRKVLLAGALMASISACNVLPQMGTLQGRLQPSAPSTAQPAQVVPAAAPAIKAQANSNLQDAQSLQDAYTSLYEHVNPSVVNIHVLMNPSSAQQGQPQDPKANPQDPNGAPQSPFGNPQDPNGNGPQSGPAAATGTGFVYDKTGDIITNNHVVEGATLISVTFADGSEAEAKLVGRDPGSDLAVIKVSVDASRLNPVTLGDSDQLKVGELVVALGNPFGLQNSMSTGIISGLGRMLPTGSGSSGGPGYSIPDMIQTDAAVNPGNSGGPLVDLKGEVIGVNNAIESPVRASSGVGYAIPASIVKMVVPQLIEKGVVAHPWLGISGGTLNAELAKAMKLNPDQRGVLVGGVTQNSPAAAAGLQPSNSKATIMGSEVPVGGDVIIAIDKQQVKEFDDLLSYITTHVKVGDTVTLQVIRNGQLTNVQLTLTARPEQAG